ncbi:eukaryotic translation initiation factor 5,putative [Leishmania mexicana MHOM/GT/2001/U1103]|uniref:Eukaryotic translation initiation factor 5,putative n=1 Tax=Leishmania mexicana (strain MHOM/GT/2001/U1103) TaxID=929439 RepID=E9B4K3_LEIMU|nr:eukaryotic translation initiation factor 5,putative [Leishmania mexicana MHOM/GT/2001/U1103]CBZ30172.1 eukaryotic translation initiation factor 5,putative [Leishmania mexicana MHOM/GT/2001/U1103]
MTAQMVPIDPDKKDDVYYRYKMPAVQTKVEGSGNGIKTVLPNIHDICLVINRPEEVLMKYFQFELGAQRTVSTKDDKFLLMGAHPTERMQDKLYDFIRKFVLCKHCHNPETAIHLDAGKKGSASISMVCGACGKRSNFDEHRTKTFMTQYYEKHPVEAKAAKGAAEARKKDDAPAADEVAAPTKPEKESGKSVGKSDLTDDREDPKVVFARVLKESWGKNDELVGRTVRLLSQYNLPEHYGPPMALSAMLLEHRDDLLSTMKMHARLLKRLCTVPELFSRSEGYDEKELTEFYKREKKIQKTFLRECAKEFATNYTPDKFAVLIFMLFVEGVLRDRSIADWAKDTKPFSDADPKLQEEMRQKVAPIVSWLGMDAKADA